MKFSATRFGGTLLLLGSVALSGCLPSGQSAMDEEKEPNFLAGKSRLTEMDANGAIEAFEKALEVNPRSASAHFELALLIEKKATDPAAAIYHYDQYLRLRPAAENAEILVKPHIIACKQELARTVSLGAVTERQQQQFEQLAEENRRLNEEVQKWRSQAATNHAGPPPPARATPASVAAQPVSETATPSSPPSPGRPATATAGVSRKHIVKSGETPTIIAKNYGVRLDALMAANPRLEARRMQVGQSLTIPSP